jgi:hypothetical protein
LYHARLFDGEEDGQSHFEDVPVDLERQMVFPPLEEGVPCSIGMTAEYVSWIEAPQDWSAQQPHLPAYRTMLVTLKGEYQVQASDGETRRFPIGSVLLLDDVRGAGHSTKVLSPEGVVLLAVGLRSLSHPANLH